MPIARAPFESAGTTTLPSVGAATRAFNEAAVPSTNSAETCVLSAGQIVEADAHDMRGNGKPVEGTLSNTPRINSAAGHTGNASHATGVVEIEAQKQKTMQRRVLAVSVASSLAAILLFAGLVLMFTGGEGIGTKVAPFTGEVVTSQLADENSAATSNDTEKTHDAKKAGQQLKTKTRRTALRNPLSRIRRRALPTLHPQLSRAQTPATRIRDRRTRAPQAATTAHPQAAQAPAKLPAIIRIQIPTTQTALALALAQRIRRECHKFRVNGIGIERIVASGVGQVTHGEIFRSARKAARRQHAPK